MMKYYHGYKMMKDDEFGIGRMPTNPVRTKTHKVKITMFWWNCKSYDLMIRRYKNLRDD